MARLDEYQEALEAINEGKCSMARWLCRHGEMGSVCAMSKEELSVLVAKRVLGASPSWVGETVVPEWCPATRAESA